MSTASFDSRFTYTPQAATQPVTISRQETVTYVPSNTGAVDIPDATVATTAFVVPFGTITSATYIEVVNDNDQDMGIRINGAVADNFQISPGGRFVVVQEDESTANPITAVSVVTTALQVGDGIVSFTVVGPS